MSMESGVMLILATVLAVSGGASAGALRVENGRCEYKCDPIGIDVAAPRLSWTVSADARDQRQTAYRILVASTPERLAADEGDLWDSGKVAEARTNGVAYAGAPLKSRMRCYWKVMAWDGEDAPSEWSAPAFWSMGLLAPEDWQGQWIQHDTTAENEDAELLLPPSPMFRKEFAAAKPIRRATIYGSALGLFELWINGKRVGLDFFTPGWTDYAKRVYYRTYDVTELVKDGDNALGAILSNGWYAGYVGFGLLQDRGKAGRAFYGDVPALLAQLEIEYVDGERAVIATDSTWTAATGPIRGNDIQMGETYDAQREVPGWSEAGFAAAWTPATLAPSYEGKVEAYPGVSVKAFEEIQPAEITEPQPGVYIFNLGQNIAGRARLKVNGPAGTRVVLRFGEMLHEDGTLMTENLRRARATDAYVLKGGGEEVWEPRFTYHGFQYVEVTGYPGKPDKGAITGIVLHSDTPRAGMFACDNPMVNQLYSNINWTQRANFFEVPTDCPQRDERLGWTGDAEIYVRSAACNRDVAAFFTKWLVDLEDAQRPYGAYPDFAPLPYLQEEPSPAWMDAGIICPYTVYKVYGDTRAIERHYDSMVRFMDHLTSISKDGLNAPQYHCWGDWLSVGATTSPEFIATAYYAYDARLMAEMAAAIGRQEDAAKYAALFTHIKDALAKAWVSPDGRIKDDTQTCYAMALYMRLLPEELEAKAAARLVELVKENDWHLSTGFLGVKHIMPALSEHGYADVAFRLLGNTTYPSWGYSVVNGATTIWERWNSYTREEGLHDPGMNSFSHYSFGSVCEWLFAYMAGIDTDGPGFRKIVIRPRPGGNNMREARASYDSINGRVASAWKIDGGRMKLDVEIPANTGAAVYVPAENVDAVMESGGPAKAAAGVAFERMEEGAAVFRVGSGKYCFESAPPQALLKLYAGPAH